MRNANSHSVRLIALQLLQQVLPACSGILGNAAWEGACELRDLLKRHAREQIGRAMNRY